MNRLTITFLAIAVSGMLSVLLVGEDKSATEHPAQRVAQAGAGDDAPLAGPRHRRGGSPDDFHRPGGRRAGPPTSRPFRDGPGRERMRPHDERHRPLNDHDIDDVLAFTKQEFPLLHDRLVSTRDQQPRRFQMMMRRVGPPMLHMRRLKDDRPEFFDKMVQQHRTEFAIFDLAEQHAEATSDTEREQIRKQLRERVAEGFAHRLERLRYEIQEFEQRLGRMREALADQEANKDELIDGHLDKILSGKGRIPFPFPPDHGPHPHKPGRDRTAPLR